MSAGCTKPAPDLATGHPMFTEEAEEDQLLSEFDIS
jgi:hypothetical protein